ncbi:MAG: 7-cyano-7-deazaguanine synthase QueC [Thermoplasmata archaeon]
MPGPPTSGAVVLLSGGMDSATVLAAATKVEPAIHALTIGYGQRHQRELTSARALARHFGVTRHTVLNLALSPLLRSALTDRRVPIPDRTSVPASEIPATYVPARNTIFLSIALGLAESFELDTIYIGVNAIDYSGYPDCRPAFLRAFERLARLATRAGVSGEARFRVKAPLLRLSKAEIVRRGERLGVPWEKTWSCYRGGASPCSHCDACRLRTRGFYEAGVIDPLLAPRRGSRAARGRAG